MATGNKVRIRSHPLAYIIALVPLLAGVATTGYGLYGWRRVEDVHARWTMVEGRILTAGTETREGIRSPRDVDRTGDDHRTYHLDIEYEYTVDGETYRNSTLYPIPGIDVFNSPEELEAVAERFPEGEPCTVYVNPDDAADSCLLPDMHNAYDMIWGGAAVFMIGGVFMWLVVEASRALGTFRRQAERLSHSLEPPVRVGDYRVTTSRDRLAVARRASLPQALMIGCMTGGVLLMMSGLATLFFLPGLHERISNRHGLWLIPVVLGATFLLGVVMKLRKVERLVYSRNSETLQHFTGSSSKPARTRKKADVDTVALRGVAAGSNQQPGSYLVAGKTTWLKSKCQADALLVVGALLADAMHVPVVLDRHMDPEDVPDGLGVLKGSPLARLVTVRKQDD